MKRSRHEKERSEQQLAEATGVVVIACTVTIVLMFILFSPAEAIKASALMMLVSILSMGVGHLIHRHQFGEESTKTTKKTREPIVMTEAEFDFLATGVQDGAGLVGARSSEPDKMALAEALAAKGLIRPAGGFDGSGISAYRCWAMTSRGIDVALSADFTPAPDWFPFGNPDKRKS